MAPPPGTLRVSRYFTALGLVLGVLYLIVLLPGTANTPKLGIDLVGGIRVIFTAQPPAGEQVTSTSMEQARQIIEDRINGSGVTASTVQIQGNDQLVVSIPGGTDTDVARLGRAAQLNFRPVIAPAVAVSCDAKKKAVNGATVGSANSSAGATTAPKSSGAASGATSSAPASAKASGSASGSATDSDAPNSVRQRPLTAPTTGTPSTPAKTPAATTSSKPASGSATPAGSASASPSPTATQAAPACYTNIVSALTKADPTLKMPTTEAAYTALTTTQKSSIAAGLANFDCASANLQQDKPSSYYIACEDQSGQSIAYLLGSVIVRGTQVDQANAVAPSTGQGGSTEWTVSLTLNDSGQKAWGDWTTAHNTASQQGTGATQCGTATGGQPCSDYVAFTLDGAVVSAPATNEPIVGQATQISGSFTQTSANTLADQLKFGALPLSFRTDSNERVSASLGTSQLQAALLAGGIGLALVVVYSLLYYRGLGLVTIASLIVSGLLTYALMVILGQQIGFTLDLAGIAGLIVALGITADSFVVFFERIKDEVHEGRSVRVAVPRGWVRARRTVISADIVSFLAAVILYIFASADVKGFAFTLGLSTVLDLFVVVVFTHPIVSLLSRSRAFGSPRFTGLNSVRAGGITPDRDEPRVKRAAASRRGDAAERAASRRGRTVRETVVLDKPDTDVEVDDLETTELDDGSDLNFTEVDGADDTLDTTETSAADDTDDTDVTDEPEAPRRRSTPSGGSAAERAAARRARQRQQRDEKGE